MFARIRYRFPGGLLVLREGLLERSSNDTAVKGFVLSPFPGDALFVLKEAATPNLINSISVELPVEVSEYEYLDTAQQFLHDLRSEAIGKAVLSRVKKVPFDPSKTSELFESLCSSYTESFVYLLESEEFGTWIGASPEVLLNCENGRCTTVALAGTIAANGSQLWTEKERNEQRMVTDDILELLVSGGASEIDVSDVEEVLAGPVRHLRTTISFTFSGDPVALAASLQPTSAVSGYPRKPALELIARSEKHKRRLYSGMIGEVDQSACTLFVNLRCAMRSDNHLYLFLGGGFTVDSEVNKEWLETENKSRTLLNIVESL